MQKVTTRTQLLLFLYKAEVQYVCFDCIALTKAEVAIIYLGLI